MLFACGIGTGLFFYGVAEPIYHYIGKSHTSEASLFYALALQDLTGSRETPACQTTGWPSRQSTSPSTTGTATFGVATPEFLQGSKCLGGLHIGGPVPSPHGTQVRLQIMHNVL